ncbi:MAG TPA: hypothetical protein VFG59_18475 [Anaeromyxobacter sp.]|nr:hypothetical protein [Anaeromyxobacter sp.]
MSASAAARPLILAALIVGQASSCATASRPKPSPPPEPPHQATEPLQADTTLSGGEAAQAAYARARQGIERADQARGAGELDDARAGYVRAAGDLLAAEQAGATAWRLPLRLEAARLLHRAGEDERAADLAASLAGAAEADEPSRALCWHLAADALEDAAHARAKAGKLPPAKLVFAEERGAAPLSPQPPPGLWKRFVEAVDAYLKLSEADPDLSRPAEEQPLASPGRLAVDAAKVVFAFDDLSQARQRLEAVLARWPDDVQALVEAIPPYLQTFLLADDRPGYEAAAARLRQLIDDRLQKAEGKDKDLLARASEELNRAVSAAALLTAQRLLDAGKTAEAAQAYEALAADDSSPDAPNALHNAAIAWDRSGEPARAVAARERILRDHPDSRVAASAALTLAAYQSRKGDHAAAARLYAAFLDRWPDHANRCIAMQNVAIELDAGHRAADAAERYLAFGRDPTCARASSGPAIAALRRARLLFDQAGKPARAKEAAAAADSLARKPKEK